MTVVSIVYCVPPHRDELVAEINIDTDGAASQLAEIRRDGEVWYIAFYAIPSNQGIEVNAVELMDKISEAINGLKDRLR